MRIPIAVLGTIAAAALSGCAAPSASSYPRSTEARLATYAKATPCCDDPSGFRFAALPKQGHVEAVIDATSQVFDFQSGLSPFAAFVLPAHDVPYRVRVKSLLDATKKGADGGAFYPVIALLDDTFIVVHMTGLEALRHEPALATPGGQNGLSVSIGIDPAEQKGKYLVVYTPAALLGKAPDGDREGDLLSQSSLAFLERRGEAVLTPSPYGKLRITIAPELTVAGATPTD